MYELRPPSSARGPFRVYFFSLEEQRMHVHVSTTDGEAKLWLDPEIELAANYGLPEHILTRAVSL